jgi:hypothetical protein
LKDATMLPTRDQAAYHRQSYSNLHRAFSVLTRVLAIVVLAMSGVQSAHADTMVSITSPIPGTTVQGTATATIHLTAPADPSTLKIQENGVDVTENFNVSSCSADPCDISATLTTGNGQIIPGWNYLYATVKTAQGIADFSHVKFKHLVGLTDSTDGSGPPHAVHLWSAFLDGGKFYLSYSPGVGNNTVYTYPNRADQSCSGIEVFVLNRGTQTPQENSPAPLSFAGFKCVVAGDNATLQTFLKSVTKDQLVLAAAIPGTPLGKMDFSPIGGTNFADNLREVACAANPKSPDCVNPFGYSIIGYGQSSVGTAYENFNTTVQAPYAAIDGNLVNTVANGTVYAFQPTRSQGFTIVPGTNGKAQILIGNMSDQATRNLTGDEGKYRVVPAGAATSATYTPPGNQVDGLWLLVLDRHTLKSTLSKAYDTNNRTNAQTFCDQVIDLASDIQAQDSSSLVFLTTLGPPIANWDPVCNLQKQALMNAIATLGVSPYALNDLSPSYFDLTGGGALSLVGVPGGTGGRSSTAIGSYAQSHKWWSSTSGGAQFCSAWVWDGRTDDENPPPTPCTTGAGETGAVRGILAIDHTMQYQPTAVTPFDTAALAPDNTSDELHMHT